MESKEKKIVNEILSLKRKINEVYQNRAYLKDFREVITIQVLELDDLLGELDVNLLLVSIY
jgi:hypothetical protein